MTRILLGIALAIMLAGCKSKVQNVEIIGVEDSQVLSCDYDEVEETKDVKFSELLDSLQIIRFENKEEAYFKTQWMHFSDNYIAVRQNNDRPVLLFDKSGKFITKVGNFGSGPGEYDTSIKDCIIDEKGGTIYLLPFVGPNILKYDFNGEYIGSIEMPCWINKGKMCLQSDSILSLFHLAFKDRKDAKFNCANINLRSDSIKYIYSDQLAVNMVSNGVVEGLENEIWSYRSAPNFPISMTYADTLYHYNPAANQLKASFTFKLDRDAHNDIRYYILNELPRHYIVYIIGKGKEDIMVDKENRMAYKVNYVNDYLGSTSSAFKVEDGYFWATYEPGEFSELLESALKSDECSEERKERFERMLGEVNENDNNILILGKLK